MTTTKLTPAARRVLHAASRLFYEQGINTVGMDLVAATANVTKKTIYDRFGSKETLVKEYLQDRDLRWRQWLESQLDTPAAPAERIMLTFTLLEQWMRHHHRGCAMINAHAELSDPRHPGHGVVVAQKNWLRRLYRDLACEAGVTQPDRLATQLVIVHEGVLVTTQVASIDDAFPTARDAAAALLRAAGIDYGEYA